MTPTEVQELKLAITGLAGEVKALTGIIDRMHKNQDKLFRRLDAAEKQLSTLQGEHNMRKGSCDTGVPAGNSGLLASVIKAVARSRVVCICLAVVAIVVLIFFLKYWGLF